MVEPSSVTDIIKIKNNIGKFNNIIKNVISEQIDKVSNNKIEIKYEYYPFIYEFKNQPLEERQKSSKIIMNKHSNCVPIIIDCKPNLNLTKKKYIVPKDLNIGQFMYTIKKKINVTENESIFLICNNTMINNTQMIINVYNKYHENDGFLYIILTLENVFGNDLKQ